MVSSIDKIPAAELSPWPEYADDEVAAVKSVLNSGRVNYWTGDEGRLFEKEMATAFGAGHAVALANGTVALELALRVIGVRAGDDVVVTPRSFFASVSSVLLAGARPIFADVDRDSQNLTVATIAAAVTPATKVILLVHLAGWPCDMPAIMAFARERGLFVIEDCAQAHGATVAGKHVGGFGDVGTFSFCQDKIMSTGGEGGALITNDDNLWRAAWEFKDHGKSIEAVFERQHPLGFRWLHEGLGTNWRMTEMQSAIGRLQLAKLDDWVSKRRRLAAIYSRHLRELPALRVPMPPPEVMHSFYKYSLFVRPDRLRAGWSRDRIIAESVAAGVPCFAGSCPEIYREKAIRDLAVVPKDRCPVARELGETSLMLLVHPTLTEASVERLATAFAAIILQAKA